MMSLWGLLGNTYNTLRELDADESLTSALVPALYFAFLFLCIVVLLNLLIAMMSDTYSSVRENSLLYWQVRPPTISHHLPPSPTIDLPPSPSFHDLLTPSHISPPP